MGEAGLIIGVGATLDKISLVGEGIISLAGEGIQGFSGFVATTVGDTTWGVVTGIASGSFIFSNN